MYNIFVLEDEAIVSLEIQGRLENLGHNICGSAACGEQALKMMAKLQPDLALLDIRLRGEMSGIDVGKILDDEMRIPFLFLTSHSDDATLESAKTVCPAAYLLKPVDEYMLRTNIEIAVHRHRREQEARQQEQLLYNTLSAVGESVITTDGRAVIAFANPAAQELTGIDSSDMLGKPFSDVIRLQSKNGRGGAINPVMIALAERRVVDSPKGTRLKQRNGKPVHVHARTSPMIDESDNLSGAVVLMSPG